MKGFWTRPRVYTSHGYELRLSQRRSRSAAIVAAERTDGSAARFDRRLALATVRRTRCPRSGEIKARRTAGSKKLEIVTASSLVGSWHLRIEVSLTLGAWDLALR